MRTSKFTPEQKPWDYGAKIGRRDLPIASVGIDLDLAAEWCGCASAARTSRRTPSTPRPTHVRGT